MRGSGALSPPHITPLIISHGRASPPAPVHGLGPCPPAWDAVMCRAVPRRAMPWVLLGHAEMGQWHAGPRPAGVRWGLGEGGKERGAPHSLLFLF